MVEAKVRDYLAGFFKEHEFADDEDIFASGYANSMFVMQLIVMVQREFSITLEDDDLEFDNFRSIEAIARLVAAKRGVLAGA
ncbi:acyl carrier protein [Dactylosporangium sp. CA-092794]|uniref:acyl carrier protein n=1 Tax=Dactylosporangium sp. CA-092794 TaxID=3239929 RepID=UPI003D8D784D